MTKCELETELIMRNVNLLWYQFRVVQLAARGPHPARGASPARETKLDFYKIVKTLSIIQ